METDQPLKIRSDLYLGRHSQDRVTGPEVDLGQKDKLSEDTVNMDDKCKEIVAHSENSHGEKTHSMDTDALRQCDPETKGSNSPPLDPGSNYGSPIVASSPTYVENSPIPTPADSSSSEKSYHCSTTFPYSCGYQSKEAISQFTECYRSLSALQAKSSQSAGLDLSVRRPELHSPSSSPPQSPKTFDPFRNFYQEREENSAFADYSSALKSLYPPSLMFNQLPSHLLPWLMTSQFNSLVNCQTDIKVDIASSDDRESQPLDLSAKRDSYEPLLTNTEMVSRVLDIKSSARGRKRADNNKKSYTDEDLHAALTAILVEKLGTRRAAQLYGIPRSTLRNKVHKLTMEKEKNKRLLEKREQLSTSSPDINGHSRIHPQGSLLPDDQATCETLKTILKIRLNEKLEEISKNRKTYLSGGEKQEFLGSVMSYLMENLPKLTLNPENKESSPLPLSSLILYPQLGAFIHKVIEDKFNEEILKSNSSQHLPYVANYQPLGDTSLSHLNIPVYPPAHICNNNFENKLYHQEKFNMHRQPLQAEPDIAFKEVLSQIISNKMNYNNSLTDSVIAPPPSLLPIPVQHYNTPEITSSPMLSGSNNKLHQHMARKKSKSPTNLGGKGSRPKRGKYRNYDRNNLVKAVKAVQSGDMSVHRAGSHFGVPHSTLEYKVKERHLNRGKKKNSANSNANGSPNPLISSVGNNSFLKDASLLSGIKDTSLDDNSSEYTCSDDVSVIRVDESPRKRFKSSNESEKSGVPVMSHFPLQSFPFWNNSAPITTPFLPNHLSQESLYASNIMHGHRDDHKFFSPLHKDTSYEEKIVQKNSDAVKKSYLDMAQFRAQQEGKESLQCGLLSTILRKRMENSYNRERSVSPADPEYAQDEINSYGAGPMASPMSQPGMLIFNSLFPSILAARTSLAAALSTSIRSESQEDHLSPIPLSLHKDPATPIAVEAGIQDGD